MRIFVFVILTATAVAACTEQMAEEDHGVIYTEAATEASGR